jgi:hypothetical protein
LTWDLTGRSLGDDIHAVLFSKVNAEFHASRFSRESSVRICWREILLTRDCQKAATEVVVF